ncbi:MAG: kinase [Clostridiales bacterium]|nr:kinase [Clostridiales bacterium]
MISALSYGSLGEVLQGKFMGIDVLCSFPVNLYTKAYLNKVNRKNNYVNFKTNSFVKKVLEGWGIDERINIKINSSIPRGKGFASSTSDILAAYMLLLKKYNRNFNIDELIKCSLEVEPTDSIIFNRATLFDYKSGEFKEELGDYIKFYAICFEGKRQIDTVKFNKEITEPLACVDDLVKELKDAILTSSIEKLAYVSSESIIRNTNRIHYSYLPDILKNQREFGGLGIIGAHSGNFLAIIFDDKEKRDFYLNKSKIPRLRVYPVETLRKDELYEGINGICIK